MNWILNFLRRLWRGRRAPQPTVERAEESVATPADAPAIEPAPSPPPSAPPALLVDGMAPLPDEAEPPFLLEAAARIGPAPDIGPADDVTPAAEATEAAEPPETETLEAETDEAETDEDLDPFISTEGTVIEALPLDDLGHLRAEARVLALSGEHRVLLSDVAGPGTLAEALNRLLQEGKVTAEFRDPEGEEPHIRYTPLPDPPADTTPS
jgi:hypothetical protein